MSSEITDLYTGGKAHYEKGEMFDALRCFEELFKKSSGFADARNMAGLMYHDRGDTEKAITCFEKALELNPNYTEVALNLAVTLSETGQYDRAKEVEKAAHREKETIDPFVKGKLANMHSELGDIYASLNFRESAIEEYRKALNLRPEFVDVRTKLGNIYRDKGDIHNAIRQLQEAKQHNPKFTPAALNLGIVYYSQGETDLARTEWESVLEIKPGDKLATMYLNLIK